MEDDKIDLKWGLFFGKIGVAMIAAVALSSADNILLGTSENRIWLAPLIMLAAIGLLVWNHKRGRTKGDELERRIEFYCLAMAGLGLIGAELFDYLLTHLDGPVDISEYVFSPMKLPFIFVFIVIFAEQGWKKKLASDDAAALKL